MIGRWKGFEISSNHVLDGNLERSSWYGKIFKDPETVFPLLYFTEDKKGLFAGDPALVVGKTTSDMLQKEINEIILKAKTIDAKTRIRMTEYRGIVMATMIYNQFPINDIFKKIDKNIVLGIMDLKGIEVPYFFV